MYNIDLNPVWLTLKLATVTTVILLLLGTPIAWWLAKTKSWLRIPLGALIALPIILPPTVIGFYLLVLMGPEGFFGRFTEGLGLGLLPFTFPGLVVGSVFYSLPFVVQPIQNAFESLNPRVVEAAATLGAGPWDRFVSIILPLSSAGFFTAAILGFAHTVGEFGVILMIGGNIPGKTKVLSVAIYESVESMNYHQAHWLAGGMLVFSFVILILIYARLRPVRINK